MCSIYLVVHQVGIETVHQDERGLGGGGKDSVVCFGAATVTAC